MLPCVLQSVIQSGQPPSVLQQLCQLPFQYFCDPRLSAVLLPSLIASCYQCQDNRVILEQELSASILAGYIEVSDVRGASSSSRSSALRSWPATSR